MRKREDLVVGEKRRHYLKPLKLLILDSNQPNNNRKETNMNGRRAAVTSFIVTTCNVLFKPARNYFGQMLFGALMRPGTTSAGEKKEMKSKRRTRFANKRNKRR